MLNLAVVYFVFW